MSSWRTLCLAAFVIVLVVGQSLLGQTAPATAQAVSPHQDRTFEVARAECEAAYKAWTELSPTEKWYDPAVRDQVAQRAVPLLREALERNDEAASLSRRYAVHRLFIRRPMLFLLAWYRDAAAMQELTALAEKGDVVARSLLLKLEVANNRHDFDAREKGLAQLHQLALENPESEGLAMTLQGMFTTVVQDSPALQQRVYQSMETMSCRVATEFIAWQDKLREQQARDAAERAATQPGR